MPAAFGIPGLYFEPREPPQYNPFEFFKDQIVVEQQIIDGPITLIPDVIKEWRVSWNDKLYNYEKLIHDYNNNNHSGIIYQTKGRARMTNLPKISDCVYVSCNKLKIMKCKIISNFVIGDEKYDIYNIGRELSTMFSTNEYLAMEIQEIYKTPIDLKGCQRTWTKMPIKT